MGDSLGMKVVESLDNLFEEASACALFDHPVGALLLHILVKRNPLDVVCHDTNLLACFDEIVHFDDVWVVDFL